ncbi:MAG TPA: hypothetical protein VH560_19100 [Polyangia bacterium]|jgi:hypothetical protein|nr:hypothetical protein [Polyangia bacterium]
MRVIKAATVGVVLAMAQYAWANPTYLIDDNLSNNGAGCGEVDLNDVTSSLENSLNNISWSGERWVNGDAWPQDFMEECSSNFGPNGFDQYEADNANFSVFSGHGNTGLIAWGTPHDGVCAMTLAGGVRLGSMSGAMSATSVYASCCTLNANSLTSQANFEWTRQQLGFHDTCEIGDTDVSDFFDNTYETSNKNAWFNHLEDRPGWFTGDNSPVVWSAGVNSTEAGNVENTASLRQQIYVTPRGSGPSCNQGQPAFWYSATYIDHGNGGCS